MDRYVEDIKQYKITESSVILSSTDVAERDYDNNIVLIPEYFDKCPSITELINALLKRLHTNQLCSIAVGCICSYKYTVNHRNISVCQYKTFMSIWGHLETLKISSSEELSRWLKECLGGRSQKGYDFKHGNRISSDDLNFASNESFHRKKFKTVITSVNPVLSEVLFGETNTVLDAMEADAKLLSAVKIVHNQPVLKCDVFNTNCQE